MSGEIKIKIALVWDVESRKWCVIVDRIFIITQDLRHEHFFHVLNLRQTLEIVPNQRLEILVH